MVGTRRRLVCLPLPASHRGVFRRSMVLQMWRWRKIDQCFLEEKNWFQRNFLLWFTLVCKSLRERLQKWFIFGRLRPKLTSKLKIKNGTISPFSRNRKHESSAVSGAELLLYFPLKLKCKHYCCKQILMNSGAKLCFPNSTSSVQISLRRKFNQPA